MLFILEQVTHNSRFFLNFSHLLNSMQILISFQRIWNFISGFTNFAVSASQNLNVDLHIIWQINARNLKKSWIVRGPLRDKWQDNPYQLTSSLDRVQKSLSYFEDTSNPGLHFSLQSCIVIKLLALPRQPPKTNGSQVSD